jgi:hypothetical protein
VAGLDESENCARWRGNSADPMIQTVEAEGMVAHQMPDNQAVCRPCASVMGPGGGDLVRGQCAASKQERQRERGVWGGEWVAESSATAEGGDVFLEEGG